MILRDLGLIGVFQAAIATCAILPAQADTRTETFAVMRGDNQIGTNPISLASARVSVAT